MPSKLKESFQELIASSASISLSFHFPFTFRSLFVHFAGARLLDSHSLSLSLSWKISRLPEESDALKLDLRQLKRRRQTKKLVISLSLSKTYKTCILKNLELFKVLNLGI